MSKQGELEFDKQRTIQKSPECRDYKQSSNIQGAISKGEQLEMVAEVARGSGSRLTQQRRVDSVSGNADPPLAATFHPAHSSDEEEDNEAPAAPGDTQNAPKGSRGGSGKGRIDQGQGVPSSPLVTPPMNSNSSPQSPRENNNYLHYYSSGFAEALQKRDVTGLGADNAARAAPATLASHGFYTTATDFTAPANAPTYVAVPHASFAPMVGPISPYAGDAVASAVTAPKPWPEVPPAEAAAASHHPSTGSNSSGSNDNNKKGNGNNKPRGVPHVYHDYSQVTGPGPAYVRKKTGGVTQPFPEKLHEMLDAESADDPSAAVVSWLPHGRAFIVRKPKEFTTQVMPKYFRQTKLTSFQRQLNLYGFRRITQGADSGAYYHEMFLQGRPSLSQRMMRQKVKGTGHKQPADVSSEPNFYAMPMVEPERRTESFGARYKPTILPPGGIPTIAYEAPPSPHETQNTITGSPASPGYVSAVNAAHLLHGFASSFAAGGKNLPFLGPAAACSETGADSRMSGERGDAGSASRSKPASFLPEQTDEV